MVTAVELSAIDGEREDLHVLGYLVDHRDAALLEALSASAPTGPPAPCGWPTRCASAGSSSTCRGARPSVVPHLAQAAFDHPANRMRLEDEGIVNSSQLLEAYLIPGAPAFRRRTTPTVDEAIALIHEVGGVAVWAHPFWDVEDPGEVLATVERFARGGPRRRRGLLRRPHEAQTRLLAAHCEANGLLTHRIGRLPRPPAPAVQPLSQLRAARSAAAARPDRRVAPALF